jgi:hypothetical protein
MRDDALYAGGYHGIDFLTVFPRLARWTGGEWKYVDE